MGTIQINIAQVIVWLVIGGIAGALAGALLRGRRFTILTSILIGLIGAFIGGLLFNFLHIQLPAAFNVPLTFTLGDIVVAFVGAVLVLFIASLLYRRV